VELFEFLFELVFGLEVGWCLVVFYVDYDV